MSKALNRSAGDCKCLRCGKTWQKRIPGRPEQCPRCKQPNWDRAAKAAQKRKG